MAEATSSLTAGTSEKSLSSPLRPGEFPSNFSDPTRFYGMSFPAAGLHLLPSLSTLHLAPFKILSSGDGRR